MAHQTIYTNLILFVKGADGLSTQFVYFFKEIQ